MLRPPPHYPRLDALPEPLTAKSHTRSPIAAAAAGSSNVTTGQKSHLDGMSEKYYVAALDAETNSVIVAKGSSHPSLFSWGLSSRASEFHWVAGVPPRALMPLTSPLSGYGGDSQASTAAAAAETTAGSAGRRLLRCTYRCRHRQELLPCTVELGGGTPRGVDHGAVVDTEEAEPLPPPALVMLRFDDPAKAVAPGQVVALYRDGVCLGGGPILRAEGHCSPRTLRPPLPPPLAREVDTRRSRRRDTGGEFMAGGWEGEGNPVCTVTTGCFEPDR